MAASAKTKQRIVDETFANGQSEVISSQAKELAADGLVDIRPDCVAVSNPTQKVWLRATQKLADEFPSQVVGNDVSLVPIPAFNAGDIGVSQTMTDTAQVTSEVANAYPISDAIPFTGTIRNTPVRTSKYPFGALAAPRDNGAGGLVYASFHIAATALAPNPEKKYAGVVSTATMTAKKKATDPNTKVVTGVPAKYVIRKVDATDPNGVGARVFRVA